MGVEGGTKCIKYLVLFFNLLFLLVGLALLGVGIWAEVTLKNYFSLVVLKGYGIDSAPRIIIAIGCIITVVAFFGCCGAWKESKCMLITFFVLMLLLFILEVTAAALAFVKKDQVEKELKKELEAQMKNYPARNKAIDELQKNLKCCGLTDYNDWPRIHPEKYKIYLPDSCCKVINETCGRLNMAGIKDKGCYTKVKEKVTGNLVAVGAVSCSILFIQLLGMIFAMVLICRIDRSGSMA